MITTKWLKGLLEWQAKLNLVDSETWILHKTFSSLPWNLILDNKSLRIELNKSMIISIEFGYTNEIGSERFGTWNTCLIVKKNAREN